MFTNVGEEYYWFRLVSTAQTLAPNLTTWQSDCYFIHVERKSMEPHGPPLYTVDGIFLQIMEHSVTSEWVT